MIAGDGEPFRLTERLPISGRAGIAMPENALARRGLLKGRCASPRGIALEALHGGNPLEQLKRGA